VQAEVSVGNTHVTLWQPAPVRPLPSRPLPSRPLPSRPLPSRPLPSRPLPSRLDDSAARPYNLSGVSMLQFISCR